MRDDMCMREQSAVPSPIRAEPPKTDALPDALRVVYCPSYSGCMDLAIKKDWPGFSCEACPLRAKKVAPRAEDFIARSMDDAHTLTRSMGRTRG